MNIIKIDDKNNQILGHEPYLIKSNINFKGKNNILICEKSVKLQNSNISFNGDNSIIYLSSNYHNYFLNVSIFNNSVLYIDENNYMNGILNLSLSEEKHIIIGKDNLFSFGIWVRLADPHLIYDINSKHRINSTKSIFIGDHVWIGQDVMILKGNHIGSGSIIGAKSLISNKKVHSNSMWAGNPSKLIKEDIFFDKTSVHNFTDKQTKDSLHNKSDDWVYRKDGFTYDCTKIDEYLSNTKSIEKKINFISTIRKNKNHNRFHI